MRIVCPICAAAYEVRDELMVRGRTVRCSRCGEEWVALPAEAAPEAEPAPEPQPPDAAAPEDAPPGDAPPAAPRLTAMDRLASHPAPVPQGSMALRLAWAASLLVVLLVVLGIVTWRGDIMQAWPPSIRLYQAIGLAPDAAPP